MKILLQIIIIGIFGSVSVFGQSETPFYEQIAFDFYRTEILPSHSPDKKLRVYKEIDRYPMRKDPTWYPQCFEDFKVLTKKDRLTDNVSGKKELDMSNLDSGLFKLKKNGKGRYPKLFVSQSLSLNEEIILVNVCEIYKWHGIYYHVKMDANGNVIDWCIGGYIA